MAAPRFSQVQVWDRVRQLQGQTIQSLTGMSAHRIAAVDDVGKRYEVRYPSGRSAFVTSDELYALYHELYARGTLTNSYMRANVRRVLGWASWNAPGSAMFAVLPRIDEAIEAVRGSLRIRVATPIVPDPATVKNA